MKTFITFLFISFSFISFNNDISLYKLSHIANSSFITSDYRYERILIDGIWWIYVYDEYDRLIEYYPDPNQ